MIISLSPVLKGLLEKLDESESNHSADDRPIHDAPAAVRTLAAPIRLHPSLEVRRDFLLFGFSEERITIADKEESNRVRLLSLVVSDGQPEVREFAGRTIEIEGQRYVIPGRYDYPPLLEEEWSRGGLMAFVENPTAPAGGDLYADLRSAVHRHIDFEVEAAEILVSLYPLISFVFPAFPAVPFLLFMGPKETGKSQALDVLSRLCRCGHKSRATAAAVGDLVESRRATLLLDQADGLPDDLLDILTDSYRVGSRRTLVNMDNRGAPLSFRTYGPKVFASHGNFDEDLLDRCIHFPMSPAMRNVEPLLADDNRLDSLRHDLYRFVALNFRGLYETGALSDGDRVRDELGLANRSWELFRPFSCVMEWLDVPEADRQAAADYFKQSLASTSAELPPEREAVLRLLAWYSAEIDGELRLQSPQLVRAVNAELDPERHLTGTALGVILSDLGLVSYKDRPRVKGRRVTEWVIHRDRLYRALERWGLAPDVDTVDRSGQTGEAEGRPATAVPMAQAATSDS